MTFLGDVSNCSTHRVVCVSHFSIYGSDLMVKGLKFILNPTAKSVRLFQILDGSVITMHSSGFQGYENFTKSFGSVYIRNSTLTVENCFFEMNSAVTGTLKLAFNGGAIYAAMSNVTISSSVFIANRARDTGGAIFAHTSTIAIKDCVFRDNQARIEGGALLAYNANITVSGSGNPSDKLLIQKLLNSSLSDDTSPHVSMLTDLSTMSTMNLSASFACFCNNEVNGDGGALIIYRSIASIDGNVVFKSNTAGRNGGAICATRSNLRLGTTAEATQSAPTLFYKNKASFGGAISVISKGSESILLGYSGFLQNEANNTGGAIYLAGDHIQLLSLQNGTSVMFKQNSAAENGGGIHSRGVNISTDEMIFQFIGNVAGQSGGGLNINSIFRGEAALSMLANFSNNTAGSCGGGAHIGERVNAQFRRTTAVFNSGSALCVSTEADISFVGWTKFSYNVGRLGGGVRLLSGKSHVTFSGYTTFQNNRALVGGAIYSLYESSLTFVGTTVFGENIAYRDGGAFYAMGTSISFKPAEYHTELLFVYNTAENGGAMYLTSASSLTIDSTKLSYTEISHNNAILDGGVIFNHDSALSTQCNYNGSSEISELPYCFVKVSWSYIILRNNSAGRKGSIVYGGLLDRCRILDTEPYYRRYHLLGSHGEITSQPYQLCFCTSNEVYNCSGKKSLQIHRGQTFELSLLALDQMRNPTSTQIYMYSKTEIAYRVRFGKLQHLFPNCSTVSYGLFSTEDSEELVLYPDGPCHDAGQAKVIVNITFLPCPDGSIKFEDKCVCEARLWQYNVNCTVDKDDIIVRATYSKFWISALNYNGTYKGLVLCKTCPVEYCKAEPVPVSLNNPDMQCANNRSGMLCGSCAASYSLMLGGSRCGECSNTYLALIVPFTAAGIALVVFLSLLRLTVATGMINGVILYANIIQANKHLFFKHDTVNILTVFIAWLNLDFGFRVCFYRGMDAYAQTWLQYAFPTFIWSVLCTIIISSRHSILVSKLIGHNPIAVLATLLLMSYTKILKIGIDVFSSVSLDYPDNQVVSVWLSDATVPYLKSKHLLLTVVTSLILIFLFLPYTLLLLLGYKLYRFSGRKCMCWLTRLKPLLDSYYAPYKTHTRCWTGFLLLLRCSLYIVFSYNSLRATNQSLVIVIIIFSIIVFGVGLIRVYKNIYINILEMSMYLNLIFISTLAGCNSPALVYSLVGVVFVTMLCIIVYHFHITYTAQSAVWLNFKTRMTGFVATSRGSEDSVSPQKTVSSNIVTNTIIELREPLLETVN
jgi:predicted outer membrane repeat protein